MSSSWPRGGIWSPRSSNERRPDNGVQILTSDGIRPKTDVETSPHPRPTCNWLHARKLPCGRGSAWCSRALGPVCSAAPSEEHASFGAINFSSCYHLSILSHRCLLIFPSLLTTRYGWHLVGDLKPGAHRPPFRLEACSLALGSLSKLGA